MRPGRRLAISTFTTRVAAAREALGTLGAGGATTTALAQLNGMVQAQAAMVAYIDDFVLMFWLTLAAVPLILLLRKPGAAAGGDAHAAAVME